MEVMNYIMESRLVLIPALYIIGYVITKTKLIANKFIPLVLLFVGIFLSLLMGGNAFVDNIIQGILVTGATVLADQVIKIGDKD